MRLPFGALLALALGACRLCNGPLDPCCLNADSAACRAAFANEAECSRHGGNYFDIAPDGRPLCEFADGGTGSP